MLYLYCICICHGTPPGLWLLLLNRDWCWSSSTTSSVFALYFHLCICLCLVFAFMCVIYLVFSFPDLHLPCNCIGVNLFTLFCHWPPPGALLAACAVIVSDLCRARCSIHFKYERLIQTSGDILNVLCHYSTKVH